MARHALRIVSDFDGVWTDQAAEAAAVRAEVVRQAARLAEVEAAQAERHFARFEAQMLADPAHFGWAPDGRITAFADEDPLLLGSGLTMFVDRAHADDDALRYREGILRAGYPSLAKFAGECFGAATAAFKAAHAPLVVSGAREALAALRELGAEVVVASNSPLEKLVDWFSACGIECGDGPRALVRLRGHAGKWILGQDGQTLSIEGRTVVVDRPRYRALLEEEAPDVVIGDVFSLDLALPLAQRRAGQRRAPRALVLREHPHTPAWTRRIAASGALDLVVREMGELVRVAEEVARDLPPRGM